MNYRNVKGLVDVGLFGYSYSLFMNVSKPRPNDHPLLVIFIVGGVTCSEVHQIREALAGYHPNTQVSLNKTQHKNNNKNNNT